MARPKTNIISKKRAVSAAVEVIDSGGLEHLTLQKVAARLGVKAPSLYHHFDGKPELLAHVARFLFLQGELPPMRRLPDWRDGMVSMALTSWRSILQHPNAAILLLEFFPESLMLNAYNHAAKFLDLNGVPRNWQLLVLDGASRLTYGSALFAAAARAKGTLIFSGYDPEEHPYLIEAVRAHPYDEEGTFVESLRSFLRGIPVEPLP